MADARALLRAKRQEARVNHPLASYTSSGQLRCVACGTTVKVSASWEGHVGSKVHRMNAARLREEEQRRALAEAEAKVSGKRKMDAEGGDGHGDEEGEDGGGAKRMKMGPAEGGHGVDHETGPANGFPADFFSDPSRAPPPPSDDEEEEEPTARSKTRQPPTSGSSIDREWAAFEQEVLNKTEEREAYERATVVAEPEIAPEAPSGFPSLDGEQAGEAAAAPALTEDELRRQKERDERELIMDRLLEEERLQEEADAKVAMLKTRLDALRRQREARKAARTQTDKIVKS